MRAPLVVKTELPDWPNNSLEVTDLTFSRSALGGYTSAGFTVPQYVDSTNLALTPLARITVFDGRHGGTTWQGYLDLPDKNAERAGQTWQIDATGPQQLLSDEALPYIGVDNLFNSWEQLHASNPGFTAQPGSPPDDETVDGIILQMQNGIAVANGSKVSIRYKKLQDSGQFLGSYDITHREGLASTNMQLQVLTAHDNTGYTIYDSYDWVTTSTDESGAGASTFGTDQNLVAIRLYRNAGGATTIGSDLWWSAVTKAPVRALIKSQAGTYISTAGYYNDPWMFAHEVVTDCLWRYTTQIDVENSSIDTTWTYQLDQIAYDEPVRFVDILNDLTLFEPDLIYEVLELLSDGSVFVNLQGHRFNLRRWPTDVRYEATTADGWRQTGGESDYRNSVVVYGVDARGRKVSTTLTAVVPELDRWGRTRAADPIDLGTELWSNANANQIGIQVLAQANQDHTSGTLTVARPIRDLYAGRDVQPWEIEPGYNVTIRGVDTEPLRIQDMTYTDSSCSTTLTIGRPVLTQDQLLNRLSKNRNRSKT